MEGFKAIKYELQNIIKGKGIEGESRSVWSAKAYIGNHTQPGGQAENTKPGRTEEERALKNYAREKGLLLQKNDLGVYITSGAEQKVFYKEGDNTIYKIADAIFYASWNDYFNSLLLNNYFFADTAYTLIGFLEEEDKIFAVVKQQFVLLTETTNLDVEKPPACQWICS